MSGLWLCVQWYVHFILWGFMTLSTVLPSLWYRVCSLKQLDVLCDSLSAVIITWLYYFYYCNFGHLGITVHALTRLRELWIEGRYFKMICRHSKRDLVLGLHSLSLENGSVQIYPMMLLKVLFQYLVLSCFRCKIYLEKSKIVFYIFTSKDGQINLLIYI